MRKHDEISNPHSCLSESQLNEMIFVLCGRDIAAPATIEFWAEERVRLGKNKLSDIKIQNAFSCADIMRQEFNETKS